MSNDELVYPLAIARPLCEGTYQDMLQSRSCIMLWRKYKRSVRAKKAMLLGILEG